MGLKSAFRKAAIAAGALLLACSIGCNRARLTEKDIQERQDDLEQEVSRAGRIEVQEERKGLRAWQYPANVIGGIFLSGSAHEGSHALAALSMGKRIDDFCLPFVPNEYGQIYGYVISSDLHDESPDSSDEQQSFYRIAGTLGDVAMIESLDYRLRNGKIKKRDQPFWATTSLVTRALMLNNVIQGLNSPRIAHSRNDFAGLEYNSGITVEQSATAIGLYTLLSYRRIKDELSAATGRRYYPESSRDGACVEVIPTGRGLAMQCRLDF